MEAGHETPIEISIRPDKRLGLKKTDKKGVGELVPVQICSCFPWSDPLRFLSVRDDKGNELAFIEDVESLAPEVRGLVKSDLNSRNFIPRIIHIDSIRQDKELFLWKVMTSSGFRAFLTKRHDSPRTLQNGKVLIKDVANDLYLIDDPKKLGAKSYKLLWMYLD